MAKDKDNTEAIVARLRETQAADTPLEIRGGGSKRFYGRSPSGEPLEMGGHRGIVNYDPTELVLTARAGTPLEEIEATLADNKQILPFEPPHFGGGATLGGAVAAGLSGPRRPFAGSVRDLVLGTRIVNGKGEVLRLGGEVIKNVAGYDLSRLMAGALGTLGVILDVSLKVLPAPQAQRTLSLSVDPASIFEHSERWLRRGFPLSACAHDGDRLYVRLSGATSAVTEAARQIGGERIDKAGAFWVELRDHRLAFFQNAAGLPLWRLALPPGTEPPDAIEGSRFWDWGGKQVWLRTAASAAQVWGEAERLGGHATCFRGGDREAEVFHPLGSGLERLHRRLKESFDPRGIFNPGRLYSNL